jgi:MYXO-CTERM domain-containing protein
VPGSASSDDDAASGDSAGGSGCSMASERPASPGLVALVVAGLAGAFASRRRRAVRGG